MRGPNLCRGRDVRGFRGKARSRLLRWARRRWRTRFVACGHLRLDGDETCGQCRDLGPYGYKLLCRWVNLLGVVLEIKDPGPEAEQLLPRHHPLVRLQALQFVLGGQAAASPTGQFLRDVAEDALQLAEGSLIRSYVG